jgi:hypothetical protein
VFCLFGVLCYYILFVCVQLVSVSLNCPILVAPHNAKVHSMSPAIYELSLFRRGITLPLWTHVLAKGNQFPSFKAHSLFYSSSVHSSFFIKWQSRFSFQEKTCMNFESPIIFSYQNIFDYGAEINVSLKQSTTKTYK